jgi:hypothetical protein
MKKVETGRICSTHEDTINIYKLLSEKLMGRDHMLASACRWENKIRMNFRETDCPDINITGGVMSVEICVFHNCR